MTTRRSGRPPSQGLPAGVATFKVRYVARRGPYKGWTITYQYFRARRDGINIGNYKTLEEAVAAYNKASQKPLRRRH